MTSACDSVPFRSLPGFPRFVAEYVRGRHADLFERPPTLRAMRALSRELSRRTYPRALLRERIVSYLRSLSAPPESLRSAEMLGSGGTLCVLTGQQAGLLTGPLYTVYKALTAIRLAALLREEIGVGVVPVFWIASEDHDTTEAAEVYLPAGRGWWNPHSVPLPRVPVETVRVDARFDEIVAKARGLAGAFDVAPAEADTMGTWFGRLLLRMLGRHGLVVVEPRLFRDAAAPVLARAAERCGEVGEVLAAGAARLARRGSGRGLAASPSTQIFELSGGKRFRIDRTDEGFRSGSGRRWSARELPASIRGEPGRFSQGAGLRPLVQDSLFPTLAYVGGPGEVTYFSQLTGLYRAFAIPMPAIVPRQSATLVDAATAKAAARLGLRGAEILSARFSDVRPAAIRRIERAFGALQAGITRGARRVRGAMAGAGGSYDRFARRIERALARDLRRFRKKADVIADERTRRGRLRFRRMRNGVLRGGVPQERYANVIPYLGAHGPGLLDRLLPLFEPLDFRHRVVYLARLLS